MTRGFVGLCLATLLAAVGVCQFFLYPIILRAAGTGAEDIGLIMGAYFAGSLAGMPAAARCIRRWGARAAMLQGIAGSLLAIGLLVTTNHPQLLALFRLMQGVAWSLLLIPSRCW